MSEFGEYLAALFLKLIPVLGAGPFLIDRLITWFWPKGRKWLDAHPQRLSIYLWAFLLGLFFAGFFAWKEERDRYMASVFRLDVPTFMIEGGTTYRVLPEDYLLSVASVPDKKTTVILPPKPHRGQRFEIKDANGAISLNVPIVVDGNGNKIDRDNTWNMQSPFSAIIVTYNGPERVQVVWISHIGRLPVSRRLATQDRRGIGSRTVTRNFLSCRRGSAEPWSG
jgi:hypothetical protein